jgi:chemotaxis protein methyltransferase CheR
MASEKDIRNVAKNITSNISKDWVHISEEEFAKIRSLVYNKIGINLTEQKKTLLMGRLQKILRLKNFENFSEYYDSLIADKSGKEISELANHISTNHTFFWRENDHFEYFLNVALPEIKSRLLNSRTNDIRIWSAGCSSGEEPYMLVMLMMEYFQNDYSKLNAGLLATDISEKALGTALRGVYAHERIKETPKVLVKKYFTKTEDDKYAVIDKVKKEVTYRRFNLMNKVFPFRKKFDIIFCRNVMIYFDDPTRETLVQKFSDLLVPGGYLFIGHSETINKQKIKTLKFVSPALYQKV